MKNNLEKKLKEKFRLIAMFLVAFLTLGGPIPITPPQALADERILGQIQATQGWATLGWASPQGAVPEGDTIQVADLETQVNVKTRWPDGSIKYAIVTANIPQSTENGPYVIRAISGGDFQSSGGGRNLEGLSSAQQIFTETFTETQKVSQEESAWKKEVSLTSLTKKNEPEKEPPAVSIEIDGEEKDLHPISPDLNTMDDGDDIWLIGPLLVDARIEAAVDGYEFLRAKVDIRFYNDGTARVRFTMENALDDPSARGMSYNIRIAIPGQPVFELMNFFHGYMTRWTKVFSFGGVFRESDVTMDFEPFIDSGVLPRFSPTVVNGDPGPFENRPEFGPGQPGDITNPMRSCGGRGEIGIFPDPTAKYLAHPENSRMKAYILAHGDLAGSWPVHLLSANGTQEVTIDRRPDFWVDSPERENQPYGDISTKGPLEPDNAHQPSLAYVPYLITGDRHYSDEMAHWANYVLGQSYQDAYYNVRGGGHYLGAGSGTPIHPGSWGLLFGNETRGIAWGLRNVAQAAALLPDGHPMKESLAEKVLHNLEALDEHAERNVGAYVVAWLSNAPDAPPGTQVADDWEHKYLAEIIDLVNKLRFTGGTVWRDQVVRYKINFLRWEKQVGGPQGLPPPWWGMSSPYRLIISAQGEPLPQTPDDAFRLHQAFGPLYPPGFIGFYGVDDYLMTLIGIENGIEGAQEAHDFLMSQCHPDDPQTCMNDDLETRAGWYRVLA